jgi:hypothetical protein
VEKGVRRLEGEEKMAYLSKEEQRRRIIELVRKKERRACPTLRIERIEEAMSPVTVFFWCKEEDAERDVLLQSLRLTEEEAKYIGVDRTPHGGPEMGG